VAAAFERVGQPVALVPIQDEVEKTLAPYPPTEWVVFNLGEGMDGRLFEEVRIVWAMEAMGYCFTGSRGDALARSTHKAYAKKTLESNGVSTPPWWLFRAPHEVDLLRAEELVWPLIVKPVAEDASIGLASDAVVHSLAALRERVAYIVERYRQAALAEMFIAGREFNVALWGNPPEVLPLAEVDFSAFADPFDRIVSFAAKWEEDSFEYHHTPVACPAYVDAELGARIAETARRTWYAIGCGGYARVDMRVSDDGTPYVVEVNCNPDISPDAGFYRTARAAGYDYEGMVMRILEIARRQAYGYDRSGSGDRWAADSERDIGNGRLFAGGTQLRRRVVERVPG
jgi:D-alanine-D-alanine ligase